jgi:hypothetical protein
VERVVRMVPAAALKAGEGAAHCVGAAAVGVPQLLLLQSGWCCRQGGERPPTAAAGWPPGAPPGVVVVKP